MKQPYILKNNVVKFRRLTLILLTLLLGGNVAYADNWPTASGIQPTTLSTSKTYYIYSSDTENTGNGAGTYKFYLLESEVDPAGYDFGSATKYEYFSACIINGGSNATSTGSGIHIKLVFNTTKPVGFVGFFCVADGFLELTLGEYYNNTDGITLKRTGNWDQYSLSNFNCPFTIPDNKSSFTVGGTTYNNGITFNYNTGEKSLDAQKIVITGKASSSTSIYDPNNQFVIDGGCVPTVNETGSGASAEYTVTYSDNSKKGNTTMFRVMCGTLSLTHVTLQNCCASNGSTGGIYVITNAGNTIDRKSSVKVDLDHCWLHHLANICPGLYIQYTIASYTGVADKKPSLTLKDCKLSDCYSTSKADGALRSHSNSLCNLTVTNCTIENNYGGGVRWQSTKACTASFTNCTINNNKRFLSGGSDATNGCGGGMIIKSSTSITGCTITNNWAQKSGGGIYFSTFDEGSGINNNYMPEHGVLSLDAVDNTGTKTLIQGNEAVENGGGVAVFGNRITVAPYYGYTNGVKDGLYTMTLNMNGAIVEDNTAGQDGGGIYVSRSDKASFYKQTCVLNYGTIQGNTAGRDGGGMAIKSSSTFDNSTGLPNPQPSEFAPQDIVVEIGKGKEGDDTQDMKILSNTATENGGGVYVEAYSLTYNSHTSNVYTTLYGHAKIQKKDGAASGNYATINGGGLYMKKGTVYFNGCTISDNKADNDGGGVYMEEGEITTAIRSAAEVSEAPTVDPSIIDNKYKIVDYIQAQCNGSNYINTGIEAYPTHTIYVHGERGGGQGSLLEAYKSHSPSSSANRLGVRFYSGGIQYSWQQGGNGSNAGTNNTTTSFTNMGVTNKDIEITMNKSRIFLKDALGHTYTNTHSGTNNTASVSTTWKIFKGQVTSSNIFKFYEAKIWSGNSTISTTTGEVSGDTLLVAHLLPCYRISDNRIGVFNKALYDGTNADACFIEGYGTLAIPAGSKGDPLAGDGNGTSTGSSTGTSAGLATATREVSGCTISSNKAQYDGGGIYLHNGNIYLTNTFITENQAIDSCGGGIYDYEGNIYLNYWDAADPTYGTNYTVRGETTPSEVMGNTAGRNGGGINTHKGRIFARGQSPSQDIKISGNTAGSGTGKKGSGGGIFCMGNTEDPNAEQLRLINVNLVGNKAYGTKTTTHAGETVTNGCGGGMYLQYGAINITKVELQGNYAEQNGGAVNNHNGVINVSGCIIGGDDYYDNAPEGNKADSCGGGIYTQNGNINISNHYDAGFANHITKISYNIAADNGGGINTHSGKVVATGEYTVNAGKHILINNNKATNGSGGGIFCMGSGTGTFADPDLKLTYAKLIGNQAVNGSGGSEGNVTTGCGGGMYLHNGTIYLQDADLEGNLANWNGGGINNHDGNIFILGSIVGGDSYYTNGAAGQGNKANHSGGGIYTNLGNVDIRDYHEHLDGSVMFLESKVTYNEAGENGGGIDTHSGIITVNYDNDPISPTYGQEREGDNKIEITFNKAKKGGGIYANAGSIITAGALIDNNWATENGGGVNNHAGDITIYGGTLSNNTAESGKGGGAFTYVGDVNILPFPVDWSGSATQPSLNDGTQVFNNRANLNGGGINNHTGRVDIRHARLKNNTSTLGNGGGIFCEGPHGGSTGHTIRLLCSELIQNKTRGQDGTDEDPTGRGGGIYLKYGSIYAHSSDILLNSANINGGGLDNHDGAIFLFGCNLIGNKAITGKGGGIYTHSGDITTGPSLARNGSSVSQATVIQSNVAKVNGGGINNHNGNIFLNGDLIGGDTEEEGNMAIDSCGGGIYIKNGQIDMFGGKIANNTAGLDGGGVWSGGGTFNIQKREGKPVVILVDVDVTGNDAATVHYHLVDQGKGTLGNPPFSGSESHGIIWHTDESKVVDATVTTLGGATMTPCTTDGINTAEAGCFRVALTGLTAEDTLFVKAYATNSDNLTAYSEMMTFITFSTKPTVISGTVAEITSNSAQGSGKLLHSNNANIIGVCYKQVNTLANISDLEVGKTGVDKKEETSESGTYFNNGHFFTLDLNSLTPGQKYYARAYAKNSVGYAYGDTVSFITKKDTPTMTGNLSIVSVTKVDGKYKACFAYEGMDTSGLTVYGFVVSTDDDPMIHADGDHTIVCGLGNPFEGCKEGLGGDTTYYVRAFASTIANPGTTVSNYSLTTPIRFTTPSEDGKPVVRAYTIANITRASATINCKVEDEGTSTVFERGVCYSTNSNPTIGGDKVTSGSGIGDYSTDLTGLAPGTTYYVRGYATNSTGTAYSNEFTFTTFPINKPILTVSITDKNETSAHLVCHVDTCGAPLTGDYGFRWKVDGDTYANIVVTNYDETNSIFTAELTGLSPNTTYWVKAFASNATGTPNDGSGDNESREVSFYTLYPMPVVDAVTIDGILYDASGATSHTIRVYSNATAGDVSYPVQKFGYIYSTRSDATIATISDEYLEEAVEVGPSNMGSSHKTDLTAKVKDNREYWVRAYASAKASPTSDSDYSYGAATKVLTLPQVNKTTETPATTHKSAQLSARIVSKDEEHFLRKYGICWKAKASGTPTVDDAHYEEDITSTPMDFSLNTAQAGSNLDPGEYYWRAYVKNLDYTTASAYKGVAYTTDGIFKIYQYGITTEVVPAGSGSVSGGGYYDTIVGGLSPAVNLTATNSTSDYAFDKWTKIPDDTGVEVEAGTTNPLTIAAGTMTSAHYKAWFTSKVTVTAGAGGQVRFGTTGDYSATANQQFSYNTSCTVSAQASSGYTFVNWTDASGNIVSEEEEYTFPVTGPITLTANFNSRGNTSTSYATPRPRDIYPAPAREPWDWDEDYDVVETDTISEEDEEVRAVRERLSREGVVEPTDIPEIIQNKATEGKGGGIYMENNDPANPTKLVFSGGKNASEKGRIVFNYAGKMGGGIYIARDAYMQMKGHCEVNGNWVPANHFGGGIYLAGRLYVGDSASAAQNKHALKVNRNFAIDKDLATIQSNYNSDPLPKEYDEAMANIFLPRNEYDYSNTLDPAHDDDAAVITLLSDISGKDGDVPYSSLGFNVLRGFCPVITTSYAFGKKYNLAEDGISTQDEMGYATMDTYESWLTNLMPSGDNLTLSKDGTVFEDSETYIAIHTTTKLEPFHSKYIYLWGSWTNPAVNSDPEVNSPMNGSKGFCGHYKIINAENTVNVGHNDTLVIPSSQVAVPLKWEIYSEEGLAWFSNYVNGLNVFATGDSVAGQAIHRKYDPNINPKAEAVLMNDLDMRAHLWVPIGSVTRYRGAPEPGSSASIYVDNDDHHFKGKFDGQGHVIKGLDCRFLTGIEKFGLFGTLTDSAVVKNVLVDEAQFFSDKSDVGYYMGGIAGKMTGKAVLSGAEARGRLDVSICDPTKTYVGGLVGQTVTNGDSHVLIHSSMAMPEFYGKADYMGGLVGKLEANDSLVNSFSNPKFPETYAMNSGKYIGGLVGENQGLVENCYSRLQGDKPTSDGSTNVFGWFAGTNNGDIKYAYAPINETVYKMAGSDPTGHTNYGLTQRNSADGKYNYAHKDQQMEATTNGYAENGIFKGLLPTLNNWVRSQNFDSTNWVNKNGYAQWSRTLASDINGDYPVLMLGDFRSLGSADNIFIHYDDSLSHLVEKFNGDDYTADHPQIFVYDADSSWVDNNSNVSIFIDENVGLTQNTGNVLNNVRVGVTLDNSKKGSGDWHFFASPLKDVPLGLEYHTKDADPWYLSMINNSSSYNLPPYGGGSGSTASEVEGDNNVEPGHQLNAINHATWSDRNYTDPPMTTWSTTKLGYFPTNTPYGTWRPQNGGQTAEAAGGYFDFYCYDERTYHWINFKREGSADFMDHWYENENSHGNHNKLYYMNETKFLEGKGYLVAVRDTTMLMADGTLNNDDKKAQVDFSNESYMANWPNYAQLLRAVNLVGNPYQSYLDFTKFAEVNSGLLAGGDQASYAVMDQDSTSYIYYTAKASINGIDASPYIHPMQSFFVRVSYNETGGAVSSKSLTFKNDMRVAAKWHPGKETEGISPFRGLRPNYPLVNLICTDSDGKRDYTTVETGRPDVGGGYKIRGLHAGNAVIYAHYNNNSYQTAFTPAGVSEVPVRFDAIEPDNFTIRWSTMHGDFSYLHLIDNLTGMDIDCLTNSEYRFQGKPSDYKSRFKLVFHCTGIDEEPVEPTNENGTTNFAFQMDDELVVNGEGTLQLFDINGRCLLSTQAVGEQSTISLPRVAAGLYVLRLTNHNQTKVQKMVIK